MWDDGPRLFYSRSTVSPITNAEKFWFSRMALTEKLGSVSRRASLRYSFW